ncbi:hypothetical protein [Ruegeria sp.]|uniref:hypothetical protein n=1 Tax=Ruegeria sp. TaxID=1879320 RepID=UPI003AFF7C03
MVKKTKPRTGKPSPREPARKPSPRLKLNGLPPAEQIALLGAEAKRVRQREEARLIRTARKAGYFDRRVTNAELIRRLRPEVDRPVKQSQLQKLETRMARTKRKATEEERRLDVRRKILLGSFLIAQLEHKPEIKTLVQDELPNFLDQHGVDYGTVINRTLSALVSLQCAISEGLDTPEHLLRHISPLGWEHILLIGQYIWREMRHKIA